MIEEPNSRQQKIIQTAQEVFYLPAGEANELAFMSSSFIQATLPHSDPGDVPLWYRQNGNYTLTIQPFLAPQNGQIKNFGIPYGSIPRLILAWANAETVKTKSQELVLGKSLSEFMDKVGIEISGGPRGGITRLKNQTLRLFSARISMMYENGHGGLGLTDARLAKQSYFFWDSKQPAQQALWESKILLTEEFYKLLLESPVPLDWRVLRSIKRSPMALDLYMWMSYRMFTLKKPQKIKWETLALQFGSEYKNIRHFRAKVRENFLKIMTIWQDLKVDLNSDQAVTLYPSRLLILPKG